MVVAVVGGAVLMLGGCRAGGSKSVEQANDDLRRENLELKKQVETLSGERDELRVKLADEARVREAALTGGAAELGLSAEALAALPRCIGIEIDGLSGAVPAEGNGPVKGVVVYIRPFDGKKRFVQAVGTMRVEAFALPAGVRARSEDAAAGLNGAGSQPAGYGAGRSEHEPRLIAGRTLSALEVREAYRAGFMGTWYVVELPVTGAVERYGTVVLRVEFADALSGKVWKAERVGAR